MVESEIAERTAARRAELDELEIQLVKQLDQVRAERDELAVAERVWKRMAEQLAAETEAAALPTAPVAGHAVLLVPHRGPGVAEEALPPNYQRILAIVRGAGGAVSTNQVGEELGPGRTHDATVARRDKLVEHLKAAGLGALADLGFLGVDKPENPDDLVIVTDYKATRARKLTPGQKRANRILAAGRAPVEHGFANLKAWRILTKLRTDPARATQLLRTLLVLTNLEADR
ncbi:transposase family protein [Streptomyces sp. NPDC050617]|uniref:transposase family protein n=1 Tax=Streptomyces sp. NPDC050617 TaxID=3154628 RepID=UPI00342EC8AF